MQRLIIAITGERSRCIKTATYLTQNLDVIAVNHLQQARGYLGQEFDAVIYDCFDFFDANAFAALCGTIRSSGALLLLLPEGVCHISPDKNRFLSRFYKLLFNNPAVQLLSAGAEIAPLKISSRQIQVSSQDQQKAVESICHVVTGHRRRPLLITSDRGRGKSAALGIAAARLLGAGHQHIIVCAPARKTAEIVFKHAKPENARYLHFYAPDELLRQRPTTELLLVDEAAAIPLKILGQLLKRYPRLVFSSTQHGYEGSGRGFATRFRSMLDEVAPGWTECKLETPIRWGKNDRLEQFCFDALLMNAEPVDGKTVNKARLEDCVVSRIDRQALLEDEERLKQLFGLLVTAHYQTRPSDLQYLLDDESIRIYAIEYQNKNKSFMVATALLAREGGFSLHMAEQIFAGKRRLRGNLVAQALAANVGLERGPCLLGDRVVRIAVHPDLQRQGFGTALLQQVVDQSGADYVSASFGATAGLVTFWKQAGFEPVNTGSRRDPSSGAHAVIMLRDNSIRGKELLQQAKQSFTKSFPHSLADPLRDLEPDVVIALMQTDPSISLCDAEKKQIEAFARQQRAYDNTLYPVWKLVCKHLSQTITQEKNRLQKEQYEIMVLKVLQNLTWQEVVEHMSPLFSGKKQALGLLRSAVIVLLTRFYD